jgi:hypothetical protein
LDMAGKKFNLLLQLSEKRRIKKRKKSAKKKQKGLTKKMNL